MLLKSDLKALANARMADAEALFLANRFDGAAYLCGYVIEITLKLRICKTMKWDGFPEFRKEFEGLLSFKTHDLDTLLHLSGIENQVKQVHFLEWSTVKIWNPESRYGRAVYTNKTQLLTRKAHVMNILNDTKRLMKVL